MFVDNDCILWKDEEEVDDGDGEGRG